MSLELLYEGEYISKCVLWPRKTQPQIRTIPHIVRFLVLNINIPCNFGSGLSFG